MVEFIQHLVQIIGTETEQQSALTLIIFGIFGLSLIGIVIHIVTKVKAAAFFGG